MDEEMNPAAELPPELCLEILARLPARDLVRFRCVSKTWCSIIDDPNFIYTHLNMFKDNSDKRFFLFWENYLAGILESDLRIRERISDNQFRSYADIMSIKYSLPLLAFEHLGYVNGLVLFSRYRVDMAMNSHDECHRLSFDPHYKIYLDLYLLNPSIRKFLMLPPLPSHPGCRAMIFFGFDPRGSDHKVVAVQFPLRVSEGTSPGLIVVYELSTLSWRVNTSCTIQVQNKASMGKGVYAKGFMHWIYYDSSVFPKPRNYTHIVSFNFASEEFDYSRLPGDRVDVGDILTFPFVLGDSFAIFDITSVSTSIWVLRKCGETGRPSWGKWYDGASDLDTFGLFQQHKDGINHVLYVEKIRKFLFAVKAKVIIYDLEARMMEGFISQCFCVMEPYVESLLLCKGIGSPFCNVLDRRGPERGE